jgi:hypothetical protein
MLEASESLQQGVLEALTKALWANTQATNELRDAVILLAEVINPPATFTSRGGEQNTSANPA